LARANVLVRTDTRPPLQPLRDNRWRDVTQGL